MPTRVFAAPAALAALALVATPAAAVPMPGLPSTSQPNVSRYGPVLHIGWGGGRSWDHRWGGRHHRHRDRTTAGDVLAGVLILGTIAAVASAAARANDRRHDTYPYPVRDRYPDRRDRGPSGLPQGLDNAADLCVREIERNARVREVTRVERDARGWQVAGIMADGAGFSCSIGGDGRIDDIAIGAREARFDGPDRQHDDARYLAARAAADRGTLPAYPGGPLPDDLASEAAPES